MVELQYIVFTSMMSDDETHPQLEGLHFFAVGVGNLHCLGVEVDETVGRESIRSVLRYFGKL